MSRVTRSPRNSVQDRPGRLKLMLRRHRWLVSRLAIGSGLVLAAGVAIIAGHRSPERPVVTARERFGMATASAGLRIKDVVITGRQNTPEPLLRAALGMKSGDPILGLSVADVRARIESLSWVEHATVERRLPGTIVVSLEERRPFAIWQNGGKFMLIDREGQVVADQDLAPFNALPLVVGPGAPVSAAPLIDALGARPALMARVIAAVRIGERRWNLRLHGGIDVLLPEGAETAALDRLEALQTDQALLDRPLQMVDMRLADRLVVRPLPATNPQSADGMPLPPPPPPPVPPDGKKPT